MNEEGLAQWGAVAPKKKIVGHSVMLFVMTVPFAVNITLIFVFKLSVYIGNMFRACVAMCGPTKLQKSKYNMNT